MEANKAKISACWSKVILRRAMRGVIPESIRRRRTKLGFDTPLAQWLRGPLYAEAVRTYSDGSLMRKFLKSEQLLIEFERFIAGRSWLPATFFFRAFLLERWAIRFGVITT